ncbi:MAG: flagellin N-terminal helical domain-containing protein [Armatimonadota bacterium]
MAMQINSNIAAMSAHRYLSANSNEMSKSIERLSSGLRINSAADDAAGMVISSKLETTVSGLTQASKNTQDGVNMFKTANKALDEITNQLRGMRDLVLHAANNKDSASAKAADQAQINQAVTAIDRISTQTEFAGVKLLSSAQNIDGKFFQIGANSTQQATFDLSAVTYDTLTAGQVKADMSTSQLGVNGTGSTAKAVGAGAFVARTAANTSAITVNYLDSAGTLATKSLTLNDTNGGTVSAAATALDTAFAGTNIQAETTDEYGNHTGTAADTYLTIQIDPTVAAEKVSDSMIMVSEVQAGATGVGAGFAAGATSQGSAGGGIDVTALTTAAGFDSAIDAIDDAMKKVDALRVNLGAFQKNNLESNLNSISVAKENLSASSSAIRDTDMASEMVNFTKSQILMQAGQAMMTQANQAPQGILQMLR